MSGDGWEGQRVKRDSRSPYVKELEEGDPETVLARNRWQKVVKSQRESRFSDGPVFKEINKPKKTFFYKHHYKISGFLMVGCAFFFFIKPIYGLFVQPMIAHHTKKDKLGNEDPHQVLEAVISKEYFTEHGIPFMPVRKD